MPTDRVIDRKVTERYEGDSLIIPVLEETFAVDKLLVLKEWLRVARWRVEKRKLHHREVESVRRSLRLQRKR